MRVLAQYRSFPRSVQLLLLNQLTINLGFYMLIPYLADHLSQGLGLSIWLVGLILGVRNFSQQGMFLIGGSLADRLGYKPMIVAGCALRTGGFVLLGLVDNVPTLVIASAATGFAGALFNPAVRAYLARDSGERRVEAFALFSVFYQTGILIGPLIGLALTGIAFSVTCLAAATVFALLTVLQVRALPARRAEPDPASGTEHTPTPPRVLTQWRQIAANRGFLLFSIAMIGSYVLSYQVYLALPLQARNLVSDGAGATVVVAAVFAVSGGVTILAQMRVTAWCRSRWGPGRSLGKGLGVLAAAFTPPLVVELATTAAPSLGTGTAGAAVGVGALLVAAGVLALGTAIVFPFEMDTIVALANDRLVATHYGFYNTVCGIGILLGNLGTGWAMDLARTAGIAPAPWAVLVLIGLVSALSLAGLHRRGLLTTTDPDQVAVTAAPPVDVTPLSGHDQHAPTLPIPRCGPVSPSVIPDDGTQPIPAVPGPPPAAPRHPGSRAGPSPTPRPSPVGPGPARFPGLWFAPGRPTPPRPGTALTGRRAAPPARIPPTGPADSRRPA